MERYRRQSFPGTIGKVDCTHVKWMMCSKDNRWLASGKESYSIMFFEAEYFTLGTADCSCAFYDTYNDSTIAKIDEFILELLASKSVGK